MKRALVVCPGRGSYTAQSLGWLSRHGDCARSLLEKADGLRQGRGAQPITTLDGSPRFDPRVMMVGADAAALTFTCGAVDLARLAPSKIQPVCFLGNSMGWYTALYGAGVLTFEEAFELVETMGGLQAEGSGSQLIYPTVDDDWLPDAERLGHVARVSSETGVHRSIRLGGLEVLAGSDDAMKAATEALPTVQLGGAGYPYALGFHAAFHTELMAKSGALGQERLAHLTWSTPRVTLVDGRGAVHRPRIARTGDLAAYTLGHQITRTFDFTAAVRVALREYAPDVVVLLGPGGSMGTPVGQILVSETWQGIRSRADFRSRQESSQALVLAMDRPDQAAHLVVDADPALC